MKRKLVLVVAILAMSFSGYASEVGIKFFKGSYAEALELAKKEKKQIFIDFFTEWCGPCLNMAENVFVLPEVGMVYNTNFICLKIDAEKGEGAQLAQKCEVGSYPTYIFLDPKTEQIVHRSGSSKPASDFIADAYSAMTPQKGSVYMNATYKKGGYDADFLKSYIRLTKTSGNKERAVELFNELIKMGAKLTDKDVWPIYVDCVDDYKNPYIMEVSNNYEQFTKLFGKKEVDQKLASATIYAPESFMQQLCDFDGKELNLKLNQFSQLIQAKKYTDAVTLMDGILGNNKYNQDRVLTVLAFQSRLKTNRDLSDVSYEWLVQQVQYLKYIAYNFPERKNTEAHYEYAKGLEYLVARSISENKVLPKSLSETPVKGKTVYDLRSTELKKKPGAGAATVKTRK